MKTSLHHSFDPYIAKEYGIEEAILIHHFQYWIQVNIERGKNYHEGRYWTYQSQENIAAHFPYLSRDQVKRTIKNLIDKEVIIAGNFNKIAMDRTTWYAFKNQEMFTNGRNRPKEEAKPPNPLGEIAQAIPHSKTDTKTDAKKDNVSDDALFHKSEKNEARKSKAKKIDPMNFVNALNEDQRKLHDELIAFIPKWGKPLKSEDVCAWFLAKKWSVEKVRRGFDVYKQDALKAENKGRSVDNMGGAMVTAILSERMPEIEDMEFNREHAEKVKKIEKYSWMTVLQKYVKFDAGNFKESLNLNMSKSQFISELSRYINTAKMYG